MALFLLRLEDVLFDFRPYNSYGIEHFPHFLPSQIEFRLRSSGVQHKESNCVKENLHFNIFSFASCQQARNLVCFRLLYISLGLGIHSCGRRTNTRNTFRSFDSRKYLANGNINSNTHKERERERPRERERVRVINRDIICTGIDLINRTGCAQTFRC